MLVNRQFSELLSKESALDKEKRFGMIGIITGRRRLRLPKM